MLWQIVMKIYLMMKKLSKVILAVCVLIQCVCAANNDDKIIKFVTTKSNEVNARSGPGTRYPTEWIFVKKGEPLAVTAEFEQWRYVRDIDGDVGWVHSSVLSNKRAAIIIGQNIRSLYKKPYIGSRVVAKLSSGLRCQLKDCKDEWCKLKCNGYSGWIERKFLWGLLKEPLF